MNQNLQRCMYGNQAACESSCNYLGSEFLGSHLVQMEAYVRASAYAEYTHHQGFSNAHQAFGEWDRTHAC